MCGIAGTFGFGDAELLRRLTDSVAHRGPDGESFYCDDLIFLGNRRLSIVDIAGGGQPKSNEDGSVIVVYNGEIYNYRELRNDLLGRGHRLMSRCDTELLPHLYEEEGIEFVNRLNGIFAFALWDRNLKKLYLVRDPIGVKPLLYASRGGRVAFGSEAKAILCSGLLPAELDEVGVHLTMNMRYIPGDRTLFVGIRRIPPGHFLQVDRSGATLHRYFDLDWSPDGRPSEDDWIDALRAHYFAAVRRQLMSDVPVGVCLSGGIDSTSILAMVRKSYSGTLKTFTLGFNEPWDEVDDARFVANRYDTEHHELILEQPALSHLKDAIYFTEEPKVNCLQLYLLHRFIGSHVKVALSGVGGDELFAGYEIYKYIRCLESFRSWSPRFFMRHLATPGMDFTAKLVAGLAWPHLDLYVRGVEWVASLQDGARHYMLLRNAWEFNASLLRRVYTREFRERINFTCRQLYDEFFTGSRTTESEALRAEFQTKLVNDLLHNEDTMSMAHSVESRVPLLDLELVRLAARIPDEIRFGRGTKGLLKKTLEGIIPKETLARRKWGFTVDPVEQYKKDLRRMALEILTPERLKSSGIFNPQFVQRVLSTRPHQRLRWHYFMLWQMIGMELWQELFLDKSPCRSMSGRSDPSGP